MSRNFRRAAWREAQRTGRSFARRTGRNVVYLAGMAIFFAIYVAIEPLVGRWQFVRDGIGWIYLVGWALAAALIFFILELCGVYLSGRPLFVRRKRTSKASGTNRWRYRPRGPSPNGFGTTAHPQKLTFGEMRASGVRDVLIYCRDHRCSHHVEVSGCSRQLSLRIARSWHQQPSCRCRS